MCVCVLYQPSSVRALKGRCAALKELGRYDDALADARRALREEPTNAELLRLQVRRGLSLS